MKALKIVFSSILAVMIIAAVAFSCNKQVETEEFSTIDGHSAKTQKVTCCPSSRQNIQVRNLMTGDCLDLCIDCTSLKNGYIETCFNYCGAPPHMGSCCPYPLHIEYIGPQPLNPYNAGNENNWRWYHDPRTGQICSCAQNLIQLTNGRVRPSDLLYIVREPQIIACFQ